MTNLIHYGDAVDSSWSKKREEELAGLIDHYQKKGGAMPQMQM